MFRSRIPGICHNLMCPSQQYRRPHLLPAAHANGEGRKAGKHVRKHRQMLFSLLIGVGHLFSQSQPIDLGIHRQG